MTWSTPQHCVEPGTVSSEDLLAYARGIAGAIVQEHLTRCLACRGEALAYARAEATLRRLLFRHACTSAAVLGEYLLGRLGPEQVRAIEQHLRECPLCAEDRRRIAALLVMPDELL